MLYLEGGGNAAIFNSFKLQTRSPVFMSRFYRVGKFAFVDASNQAFIVYLMNWECDLFPLRQYSATLILRAIWITFKNTPRSPMRIHPLEPFFPKSQVDRVGNYWMCPVLILKRWLPVSESIVRAFVAILRWCLIRTFLMTHCHIFMKTRIFLIV